jgi:hypothetical protein
MIQRASITNGNAMSFDALETRPMLQLPRSFHQRRIKTLGF